MAKRLKKVDLSKLKPGDPVEIVWQDAMTRAIWTQAEDAAKTPLAIIMTRGTLVAIREDAVVVALDAGIAEDGSVHDYHGVGVIEINSVIKARRLR